MPSSKEYAKRLAKGSAVVFVALVISGLVGFLLRMFLTRTLSVEEYGLFYAIFALVSFFALFRDLGLNSALVKYIPEFQVRRDFKAIKSSITFVMLFQAVFAFLVAAILFAFSGRLALVFFRSEAAVLPLQILSVWSFTMVFYSVIRSAFQGFQNMPAFAGMEFSWITLVFISAVLFVGVLGQGIGGVAFAYLVATLVMIVFGLTHLGRRYTQISKKRASVTKSLVKKLFVFALPVFIGGLGGIILGYTDTLMITAFRGLTQVALYQAAQPITNMLWTLVGTLTTVFFPMVSELWAKQKQKFLNSALQFLIKFSFILIIPAVHLLVAFPEIILRLLFGDSYLAAATVLQILGGVTLLYAPFTIMTCAIGGIGAPLINTKVVVVMACLNFFGNLLLIPSYGIEGAAVATFCATLAGLVLSSYYLRKILKLNLPILPLFKTVAGGMLTLIFIFVFKSIFDLPPWPEAFAVMVPSLLFYGIWILAARAITKEDLRFIVQIVPLPGRLVRSTKKIIKA